MITFDRVTKRYPDGTVAVDALDLEIPPGKTVILVGPSGCGKTTSLRMINRLIEPTYGRILIDGHDVMQANPSQLRRGIGYVIQQTGLFPHRTIEDNIATVPLLQRLGQGQGPGQGPRADGRSSAWTRPWPGAIRTSCPAASSSASAWPGRWPPTRRCC